MIGEIPDRRFAELAFPVPPVQDETLSSYIPRLARANHVRLDHFMEHLTGRFRQYPRLNETRAHALAVMINRPLETLLYALPELRGQAAHLELQLHGRTLGRHPNRPGWLCRRCRWQKLIATPVTRWQRHDQNVCLRHGLWIGEGVSTENDQVDLTACPEIIQAHRYHRCLISRLGRVPIAYAYYESRSIQLEWVAQGRFQDVRARRFDRLLGSGWRVNRESAVLNAVIYPEVVALTGILASAYWRSLAASLAPMNVMRFYGEVGNRVHPGYRRAGNGFDPLRQWVEALAHPVWLGRATRSPSAVFAANEHDYLDTH